MIGNQTLTLIYNPLAGPADTADAIGRVADLWRARDWEVAIRATEYPGHAVELAREAALEKRRLVLAAGGDGTLGEVATGLARTDTIMGPLPMGTGNSFGKELRMPRPNLIDQSALVKSAELLLSARVHRMDLGRFNDGDYWMLWTGTGIDSFVVSQIEPRSKLVKRLGPAGYVAQAFATVPRFEPMTAVVTVDGARYEGEFILVLVSNCRLMGGEVLLNPGAALDDGQFEVFMFRGHGTERVFNYLWQVWRGEHHDNPDIVIVPGKRATVKPERTMPVQRDGDPAGVTPLNCQIVEDALWLLVPRTAPHRLFQRPGLALL